MGLRGKFLLGFGALLLILLVFVAVSMSWLSGLGSSIDTILRENYRSVIAAQEMKEALERLDSGALFSLLGVGNSAHGLMQAHQVNFEAAYARALSNVTLEEETPLLERIDSLFRHYQSALAKVLDQDRSPKARRESYFSELLPVFEEIKDLANQVLRMNQENMVVASVRARELAVRSQQQVAAMAVVGILLAVGCVVFLSRATLRPIQRLTASVREIEKGNFQLAVESGQADELGKLTKAFNRMATALREYRRIDQAKIVRAQRITNLTINSLPDAVFLLSPEGQVQLTNRTATTTFNIESDSPLPEKELEWLQPLLRQTERHNSAEPLVGSVLQRFIHGTEQFFLPTAVAIRDETELVGISVVLSNVTHLRRLDEMKNNMLATVSHELLTPITSLEMALSMLLEEKLGDLSPRHRELLQGAAGDVDRLQQMIEDLLDVSRLRSGKVELNLTPVEIRSLTAEAVALFNAAFQNKQVALEVLIDPEIQTVMADPSHTQLIFSNLLSNALKNTPAGGHVALRATRSGDRIQFSVTDTGRGIPTSELDSIFERFHQTPGSEEGIGLGLAITRQLVEAHGGEIKCTSAEGVGSCFSFELPA